MATYYRWFNGVYQIVSLEIARQLDTAEIIATFKPEYVEEELFRMDEMFAYTEAHQEHDEQLEQEEFAEPERDVRREGFLNYAIAKARRHSNKDWRMTQRKIKNGTPLNKDDIPF